MKTKNFWIAALSGAALTTLVSNLPFIGLVNILCFAGFWGGSIFSVWLYRRLNGTLTAGDGLRLGVMTGLCAGALGFGLSFAGLAGLQGLVNELKPLLSAQDLQNAQSYTMVEAIGFNLVGVLFNVIFGTIGGWIGGLIFRTDRILNKTGEMA